MADCYMWLITNLTMLPYLILPDYFFFKVNRKFLGAWTLMGHEFVEMKNTGAAIEHYRSVFES